MGVNKRTRANKIKEAKKSMYYAKLSNSPIPPRKMRLLADLIRGKDVNRALDILRSSPKRASQDCAPHRNSLLLQGLLRGYSR